jgi:hypothetical protein
MKSDGGNIMEHWGKFGRYFCFQRQSHQPEDVRRLRSYGTYCRPIRLSEGDLRRPTGDEEPEAEGRPLAGLFRTTTGK